MTTALSKNQELPQERALRVLVVDNSADSADMAAKFLGSVGHQVVTARNGTEALVVAESFMPHAVLIDIGLPGVDGFHVARELRKKGIDALLVATTGRAAPEELHSCQMAGFDSHMVKPVDFPRLVDLLATEKENRGGCRREL